VVRRSLAIGVVLAALYAALAAWSGHLTPVARGPLLDGLVPVNYRWVVPPPELESINQQPSSGSFPLQLGPDGVTGQVVFTSDNQVTVIVAGGSIAAKPGQDQVKLDVLPLDPGLLGPVGGGLTEFGNAYQLRASYRPSGTKVQELLAPLDVILVYPTTAALHSNSHQLMYSADGTTWDAIESSDSSGQQNVEGNVPGFGYVVVAGTLSPSSPVPAGPLGTSTTSTAAIILLVVAGCVLLIGIGLLIRSRN
jgi:hypothetical protein